MELSSALSKSFKTQANTTPCLMSALPIRGASPQSMDGNRQRQDGRTARVVKVYSLGACFGRRRMVGALLLINHLFLCVERELVTQRGIIVHLK